MDLVALFTIAAAAIAAFVAAAWDGRPGLAILHAATFAAVLALL